MKGKDCPRCKGSGWLIWQRRSGGWGWASDAIVYLRAEAGTWHPLGYVCGFSPVCPCTVSLDDAKSVHYGLVGPLVSLISSFEAYQVGLCDIPHLARTTDFTVPQVRIQMAWLATRTARPLRGALAIPAIAPDDREAVFHIFDHRSLPVGELVVGPDVPVFDQSPPRRRASEDDLSYNRRSHRELRERAVAHTRLRAESTLLAGFKPPGTARPHWSQDMELRSLLDALTLIGEPLPESGVIEGWSKDQVQEVTEWAAVEFAARCVPTVERLPRPGFLPGPTGPPGPAAPGDPDWRKVSFD